ncbi:hypothetical protein V6S67_11940 [Arthrobacter sp. Soc17.1.1.1]|uniref:hypothetical protein n=1 Tax=Arthrobacter sp. Soc17.1.1.1 TaxID=3121277 RepID=UPI002FE42DE3
MTLPSPARLLCAALLSFGLVGSAVPAVADDVLPKPSVTAQAPSTTTAPAVPATPPALSTSPTSPGTPVPADLPANEPAQATTTPAQDEITSFVPDLDWNPLADPDSDARYGEHYTEPATPLKAASPLSTDGGAGLAAIAPRSGTFKVTLVTVQLSGKTVADTNAINMGAARNSITSANAYWNAATAGRLSMTQVNEFRHVSAARITDSYGTIMATVTKELNWQYRPYESLVIFVPHADLNYNGSWGILGGGFTDGPTSGRVIMPYPSALTNNVVTHEFGHVLGLHHANSLACTNARSDVPRSGASWADPSCWSSEYGDTSDLMGFAQISSPQINAFLWEYGGFGRGDEIRNLGNLTSSQSVTLRPWGGTASNRAVKFTDPASGETYYLELRAPVGSDAATAVGGNRGVKITKKDILGWSGNASIVLTPNSQRSGWGNSSLAWQQGQTFTAHTGTRVSINSVSNAEAVVTISSVSAYASYFKYSNMPSIYGRLPNGTFRALSWDEYSQLGQPGYQTLGPVSFVMNSWNGTIYLIGADNKGQILSFQDWDAYGRPNPTVSKLIPGTYFTTKFDSKLYYMSPAGEIPATDADYKAAGSPPLTLPTRYVKYDWDTTVYQQKATSLTASTATTVSHDQWAAAGFPAPQVISYIPGTTFFKYTNLGTIFMKTPTGATHPATYDEWRSAPLSAQGYTDAGQARFVMNSWNGTIYLIGADNKGQILSFQDWDAYGRPNPTVSKLIPGTYFTTKFDSKLYYMSPAGEIPATDADYKAAGSPPLTLPTRYVKYDWDTTVYQQKATSLTASTATTVSHDQWAAAGFPAPQVISYIPGTTFFKYTNLGTIFMKTPTGATHPATYDEWRSAPLSAQGYTDAGQARFVMNSWNGTIYLIGADNKGQILSFQDWDAYGRPNPTVSKLIPGTYFTRSDNKLYYMSPAGQIPATDADYKAAGSPPIRTS